MTPVHQFSTYSGEDADGKEREEKAPEVVPDQGILQPVQAGLEAHPNPDSHSPTPSYDSQKGGGYRFDPLSEKHLFTSADSTKPAPLNRKTFLGLPPFSFILYIGIVLALLAAIGVATGVTSHIIDDQKSQLSTCRSDLSHAEQNASLLTDRLQQQSPPNTTIATDTTQPYQSDCTDRASWQSNLTELTWTSICSADIAHHSTYFDLIAGAVVPTFQLCAATCDALMWKGNENITMLAWSWGGNSSAGIGANPPGKCWCLQTYDDGYYLNHTRGIDVYLREGTYDAGTLGSLLDGTE